MPAYRAAGNISIRGEAMKAGDFSIIEQLDAEDKEKLLYFAKLLLGQSKYKKLREEIEQRRAEIREGEVLTHEEIWSELDV